MGKQRCLVRLSLLLLGVGLGLSPGSAWSLNLQPEDLVYAVDVAMFKDAARVTVSFKNTGNDVYEAEIDGSVQGFASLFTGRRRDRFRSRMTFNEGRLKPLYYSEEVWRRGRYRRREYHFDQEQGRLELWTADDMRPARLTWQTDLQQTVYDPVSALYNLRAGTLGAIRAGESLVVPGLPYPRPEDIIFRIGPQQEGRQKVAMQVRRAASGDELDTLYLLFNRQWVPVEAWTWLGAFGKVSGRLTAGP